MLNDEMLGRMADDAQRLSGYTDELWLQENVDGEGTTLVFRAPSLAEFRDLWAGLHKDRGASTTNARRRAMSRVCMHPELPALNEVIERYPKLPEMSLDWMLRLAGAGDWTSAPESVVVDDASAAELVAVRGVDAAKLTELRKRYHHRGQLRAVIIGDQALGRPPHTIIVKTPTEAATTTYEGRVKNPDDVYDAQVDLATDCIVDRQAAAIRELFARAPALPTTLRHVLMAMAVPARESTGKGWRRSSARSPT